MISGHGHVTPNPDGTKARCGGPAICSTCAMELAALKTVQKRPRTEGEARVLAVLLAHELYFGVERKAEGVIEYIGSIIDNQLLWKSMVAELDGKLNVAKAEIAHLKSKLENKNE